MTLDFDLARVRSTEFGVGRDDGDGQTFSRIPINAHAQRALREMVDATSQGMQTYDGSPKKYEPSEKHAGIEHLFLPLEDELAAPIRHLHEAVNLPQRRSRP